MLLPRKRSLYLCHFLTRLKKWRKKGARGITRDPACALAVRGKARAEISYTQNLCRGSMRRPTALLVYRESFSSLPPIENSIIYGMGGAYSFRMALKYSVLSKSQASAFFRARAIFKIFKKYSFVQKRHTARRVRYMRVGR